MNRKIIFDTDPGIDDAIAFYVLNKYARDRVLAFFTTYGNMPLLNTTNNAMTVLSELNWNAKVIPGAVENPDRYENASYIHGIDGLAGLSRHYINEIPENDDFTREIYEIIVKNSPCDYIAVGPLTNLAQLLKRHPDVKNHLETVSIMGGGFQKSNVTDHSEFNIDCDPESAKFVFETLDNIMLAPLDLTLTIYFDREEIPQLNVTPFAKKILASSANASIIYGEPGSVMHDSTAVLMMLFPEEFVFENNNVEVITSGEYAGQTIKCIGNNVKIGIDTDQEKMKKIIKEALLIDN